MAKNNEYYVVFENKIDGIRTFTPFPNKDGYQQWLSDRGNLEQFPEFALQAGVTEAEAHQLIDQVPIRNYVVRAIRNSVNPDTLEIDHDRLEHEMTNVAVFYKLRTNLPDFLVSLDILHAKLEVTQSVLASLVQSRNK